MAKKKAARGDFNMSQEIRALLTENPNLSSGELYAELGKRFPGQEINRNSCNVAYSQARRKLGIRPGSRRSVKVARPGRKVARTTPASTKATVNFDLLKSAHQFLAVAGSPEVAISALQQLAALQIK